MESTLWWIFLGHPVILCIIKSPWYRGGDFMFFLPVRTPPALPPTALLVLMPAPPPAADSCSRDNFWTFFLDFFHFWHDCWSWPVDYLIRFWLIFVVTLTKIFQGQIWNLLYLRQKLSDCHKTKSKHIDWTLGLKCNHCMWPWPWPWPWIFKVKYRISYISAQNGPIATKQNANILTELKASNMTIRFNYGHDLDLEFSRSKVELAISQPKMVRLPRNEKQTYRLNTRPQMWPMGLTLNITLTLQFWRSYVTLTFDHTWFLFFHGQILK